MVRRPGIRDVAAIAGCSHQTVSRALNDDPRVSDETKARVLAAASSVGYRRNAAARALKTSQAGAIGILAPASWRYGPMAALHAVESAARTAGFQVVLAVQDAFSTDALSLVEHFADAYIDGIIAIAPRELRSSNSSPTNLLAQQWAATLPVVYLAADDTPFADGHLVSEQQEFGARLATKHLIDAGHTRIGHVAGDLDWLEGTMRMAGWQHELQAHGIAPTTMFFGDWSGESGYQTGLQYLTLPPQSRPTGIFVASDLMALGFIRALVEHDIRIPDDVSIVGFDDHEFASQFSPPLTTVRRDFKALGEMCVNLIREAPRDGSRRNFIPPTLVSRASVSAPKDPSA